MQHSPQSPSYFPHNRDRGPPTTSRFKEKSWIEHTRSRSRSHTPEDSRFELLYRHAMDKKHRMEELTRSDQERFDRNFKFQPRIHINANKHDYDVGVVERNELWMQQRKKKLVEIEQSEALRKLRPCTFSPNIASKMNTFYLKQKAKRSQLKQNEEQNKLTNTNRYRGKGKLGYEEAKRSIQQRITTMHI